MSKSLVQRTADYLQPKTADEKLALVGAPVFYLPYRGIKSAVTGLIDVVDSLVGEEREKRPGKPEKAQSSKQEQAA